MLPAAIEKAVYEILSRGNTAEIKRRKDGEIIVLEAKKKIKATVQQTGGTESQAGL